MLVDQYGETLARPWLTKITDSYSRCIMGMHLGFDAPSSLVVALAMRHAVLPKKYPSEYKLHCEWGTFGIPENLFTDGGKDFRSEHLKQIGFQLGFECHLRDRPSEGGIEERSFGTINTDFLSRRVLRLIKESKVEMLIIDEANFLKLNTFSEIARIYDLLKIAIVLVGTDGLDNLIKKEPYIHDRFIECYRLQLVSEKKFAELLQIWEDEVLCLPVPSNLTRKETLMPLYQKTGGKIGLVDRVLRRTAILSLRKGLSNIDKAT
jgi:hypothetical protein